MCLWKWANAGVSECRFYWIWLEISRLFKYKNGGVETKNFIVELLKWSFLRFSRNIFFGTRCIVSVKRATTGVWEGLFCWSWLEISHFLNIKTEESKLKILSFNYLNDFFLDSVETYFLEGGKYCLWKDPQQFLRRSFLLKLAGNITFCKYKNGGVAAKNFIA